MSGAFVRESDDQWLEDVRPTVQALLNFLSRENNGVAVHLLRTEQDSNGRDLFIMSNGLVYYKDDQGTWRVNDK